MKKVMIFALAVVLGGCTTKGIIERQINTGVFNFSKSNDSNYDYNVKLERTRDINWDVANKEDRLMIIRQMLGNACVHPMIVNEEFISRGKSFGVESGTYLIEVSCQ